jgi:Ca2+-binding EF-hand superfamily protein
MSEQTRKSKKIGALLGGISILGIAAIAMIASPAMAGKNDEHSGMQDKHKERLEALDTNKDGIVSKEEVEAAKAARFAVADADGNGSVSFGEFEAMKEKHQMERRQKHFAKKDKNGDGVLSMDEVGERRSGMFEKLDLNGDGEITKEERDEAHEKFRDERKDHHKGRGRHHKDD